MVRAGWYIGGVVGGSIALATVLSLFRPIPVDADMVYGYVYDKAGQKQPGLTFRVTGRIEKDVKTGQDGGYQVFLPPGIYNVQSGTGKAVLQSLPEPFRQDIHLK